MIYYFFIIAIGIVLAIGIGLEISKGIEEFVIQVLFWLLYIVTIITFVNIFLVGNYYLSVRNKTGPPGQFGVQGERGDKGEPGKCDSDCRDQYCYNILLDPQSGVITQKLRDLNNGDTVPLNNVYIKSKVKQMCSSDEFKQLAPYNGPANLVSYLGEIWKIWIDQIYKSGGALFFRTIGAEEQFEWLNENPFEEIKKYDIFYWGMGRQYRPKIVDKCYPSRDGVSIDESYNDNRKFNDIPNVWISYTDLYDFIQNDEDTDAAEDTDISFWRARQYTYDGRVFYPVGDVPIAPNRGGINKIRTVGNMTLPTLNYGPNRSTILVSGDLQGPISYELLWENSGLDGNNFWIWRPIAPNGFIALGDVVTASGQQPATGNNAPIRCVPYNMVIRIPSNGNIIWNSWGIWQRQHTNLLGFESNYGGNSVGWINNAYNLFRCVLGWNNTIPESDVNGSFYYIDPNKSLNIGNKIDNGNPDKNDKHNRVGKGWTPASIKDSKYSVLSYLKLKNNPVLTHTHSSNIKLNGQIIDNAIGNTYTISYNGKCLKVNDSGAITLVTCDNEDNNEFFSILLSGVGNECRILHKETNKYLKYKQGLFTLQDQNEPNDKEYLTFNMD